MATCAMMCLYRQILQLYHLAPAPEAERQEAGQHGAAPQHAQPAHLRGHLGHVPASGPGVTHLQDQETLRHGDNTCYPVLVHSSCKDGPHIIKDSPESFIKY